MAVQLVIRGVADKSLTRSCGTLGRIQESGQTFSDSVMQAAVLFEHGGTIAARDFVNVHRHLDHGAIQGAEGVEEPVDVVGLAALGAQISTRSLFGWLGHRMASAY